MFPKIDPLSTEAWQKLQQHYNEINAVRIKELFRKDPDRSSKYSLRSGDILFDYSKNSLTDQTISLLLQLASETKVKDAIDAMFAGEKINETENRSVLHTALRNFSKNPVFNDGKDVMPDVKKVLRKMKKFS